MLPSEKTVALNEPVASVEIGGVSFAPINVARDGFAIVLTGRGPSKSTRGDCKHHQRN
jgi:hypothetical protein